MNKLFDILLSNCRGLNIICDDKRCITYNILEDEVGRIVDVLNKNEVSAKSNIGIIFDNCIEFVESYLAVNCIGAVVVPLYSKINNKKLFSLIESGDIGVILTKKSFYIEKKNILEELKCEKIFSIDAGKCQLEYNNTYTSVCPSREQGEFSLLLYTSGTSGIEKGVMLIEENIVASIKSISNFFKLKSVDNIFIMKSIIHVSTLIGELFVGMYSGCSIYLSSRHIIPRLIFNYIKKNEITFICLTPSLAEIIINEKFSWKETKLRKVHLSGESIFFEGINRMCKNLRGIEVIQGYGLTEASPRITQISQKEMFSQKNSVGRAIGNQVIKIIKNGNECAVNVEGEVIVQGDNIMLGYYKDPLNTQFVLKDKWLYTGDCGYLDENGYLYLRGRKDNMIIKYGRNIYIEEIESVLKAYEGIMDVLVKNISTDGVPFLEAQVIASSMDISISEIYAYCKDNLDDYKVPDRIIFVQSIKKTISGKKVRK